MFRIRDISGGGRRIRILSPLDSMMSYYEISNLIMEPWYYLSKCSDLSNLEIIRSKINL